MLTPRIPGTRTIRSRLAFISLEFAIAVTLFGTSLFLFGLVARMVFIRQRTSFDEHAFKYLRTHVSDNNTQVMEALSFMGSHTFLVPANLAIATIFLLRKHRWYSLKVPVISLSGLVIMLLLKQVFQRPRPLYPLLQAAQGLSFPSGHALVSVTFYGLLTFLAWHRWRHPAAGALIVVAMAVLVIMIGTSRVYLRVHYASDVIAGFCVGLVWLLICLYLLHRIEKMKRLDDEPTPVVQNSSLF